MKLYRLLGIVWLVFCAYGCMDQIRSMMAVQPGSGMWPVWIALSILCVLYGLGFIMSFFLFRGLRWARWCVAGLAGFIVLAGVTFMVISRSVVPWTVGVCVFSTVSFVLLVVFRHETVA